MPENARVRNVAFVGPHHSGKTTLVEALLAQTKSIPRRGSVADGTATTDYEPECIDRAQSTSVGFAHAKVDDVDVTLIDCPGFIDFLEETKLALLGADAAVVVLEADPSRVRQTRTLVEFLDERKMPHCFFINKLDRPGSDFRGTLNALVQAYGTRVVAEHLPIGEAESFRGYIDVAEQHAYLVENGAAREVSIAPELEGSVRDARTKLLEALGDFDDHLLEELLEGIEPPLDEVRTDLRTETAQDQIVPVVAGAGVTDIGAAALADVIVKQFPAPESDPSAPLVAQVCKTIIHPQSGKLSVVRIWEGTLNADATLNDVSRGTKVRASGMFRLQGKKQEPIGSAVAGEIVAVARLEGVLTGDTLATTPNTSARPVPSMTPPLYAVGIRPKERLDEAKLSQMLARLCEEDPSLSVERAEFTNELQLLGAGEVHVATATQRLSRKYHLALETSAPTIAYRETITGSTEQHARYKHQTGGHGQFADVVIRIEARERGHGVTFSEQIVGGVVPRTFFPAVEKGVREALLHGPIARFPVVDLHVTLIDGQYHDVDSSEAAFKTAAAMAIREGLPKCGPVLLEPLVSVEAIVPEDSASSILGGLTSKRGQVLSFEPTEPRGFQRVSAIAPQSEVTNYITELRTATQGLGTYTWRHERFEMAPPKVTQTMREAVAAAAAH
ncbi:MAG: elongation factor G [Candidatus Eremiobacteraeota bacterium]|nr:elongation factor G [Candidatus Eremiobacteraeota bacterium]